MVPRNSWPGNNPAAPKASVSVIPKLRIETPVPSFIRCTLPYLTSLQEEPFESQVSVNPTLPRFRPLCVVRTWPYGQKLDPIENAGFQQTCLNGAGQR